MTILKTPEEIVLMRESGRRLAKVIKALRSEVVVGAKTIDLDTKARELIEAEGCKPAFLGYQPGGAEVPFPFTICSSINETVVHGLPSNYEIKDGDLVKLDFGLIYEGFYSDSAFTVGAGNTTKEEKELIKVTEEALWLGIKECIPGKTLGDIGAAIGGYVGKFGFGVIRELVGHGIGKSLHEEPYVFNFGKPGTGKKLEEGMVLAIEPMISLGTWKVKQLPDDSFVTTDGSKTAHFEHTVAITERGPKVLTVL